MVKTRGEINSRQHSGDRRDRDNFGRIHRPRSNSGSFGSGAPPRMGVQQSIGIGMRSGRQNKSAGQAQVGRRGLPHEPAISSYEL